MREADQNKSLPRTMGAATLTIQKYVRSSRFAPVDRELFPENLLWQKYHRNVTRFAPSDVAVIVAITVAGLSISSSALGNPDGAIGIDIDVVKLRAEDIERSGLH
jgi:hypothetical protein